MTFFNAAAAASDMDTAWVESHWQKIPNTKLPDGNYRTGPVRLGFPWLFKPQPAMEAGKKDKFSAVFCFPHGADLSLLKQHAGEVTLAKWPNAAELTLFSPFADQKEKAKFEGFAPGATMITASGERKPLILDTRGAPIVDEDALYPGCWVLGLVNAFTWEQRNAQGVVLKRGTSFGLNGVIKIADDKRLGGGGVDVQSAVGGLNIDQSVNVAGLF